MSHRRVEKQKTPGANRGLLRNFTFKLQPSGCHLTESRTVLSKNTPPKKKKPVPAGAAGPAGIRVWGPGWLVAIGLILATCALCYFGYLGSTLIAGGHAEGLELVLRGD